MVATVEPTNYQHRNDTNHISSDDGNDSSSSSGGDTCSVNSSTDGDKLGNGGNSGALVFRGESVSDVTAASGATFGSVAVTNSTDVHFGNKTYYQGPVTIKQILYAGQRDKIIGEDDLTVDGVVISNRVGEKDNVAGVENGGSNGCDSNGVAGGATTNGFVHKWHQWLPNVSRNRALLFGTLAMVFMVLLTVAAVLIARKVPGLSGDAGYPEDSPEQETWNPIDGPNVTTTLPGKLKIVSRIEWVAQPPSKPINPLLTPVPYVIIMHTATENCTDQPACVFHVRHIQSFHMDSNGWWDIGYNFLVGGDGLAYEGRGWKFEGAHTYGYNTQSIGIAFVGTFNNYMPPERQIVACKRLIAKGLELGYLKKDYKVLAARQVSTTQSPGDLFYENIKTWPHWSEKP